MVEGRFSSVMKEQGQLHRGRKMEAGPQRMTGVCKEFERGHRGWRGQGIPSREVPGAGQ